MFHLTYPDLVAIIVPTRFQAEIMRDRFGGTIEEIPGQLPHYEEDAVLARHDANDLAWDQYIDQYHRGVPEPFVRAPSIKNTKTQRGTTNDQS